MTDVERLFADYKALQQGGGAADPRPFLERLEGTDREQLAGLIDAYLARAARRPGSMPAPAAAVAESLERSLAGSSGLWPSLLPRLRNRARIRRADLVAELAARLGAQAQQPKVASYYHQMEQGLLPASGVSDAVLEALGRIVGYGAEGLRRAGAMPAPGGPAPAAGAVFTRPAPGDVPAPEAGAQPGPPGEAEWDQVDRLFRGG